MKDGGEGGKNKFLTWMISRVSENNMVERRPLGNKR